MQQEPTGLPVTDPAVVAAGKTWAMLSYASLFVGLPLCVVPLLQRDNAFALYHAKQATAAGIIFYALWVIWGVLTTVTCGIGVFAMPIVFVPYVSMVHGLMIANNGETREPLLVFGIGDKLFSSITVKTTT